VHEVLFLINNPLTPAFLVKGGEYMVRYALKHARNTDFI